MKALAAVDGLVTTGLERNLGGGAATVADDFVHLAIAAASAPAIAIAPIGPAGGAAAGFVCKALLGEKRLFRAGEYEVYATITAG